MCVVVVFRFYIFSIIFRDGLLKNNIGEPVSAKERFRSVCRGIINESRLNKRFWLRSVLIHRQNPFLKLGPFKVQPLSESPIRVIIHDIFSDYETDWLYSLAMKNFNEKTDIYVSPEAYENVTVSSQSNAVVLEPDDHNYNPGGKAYKLMKIYDRITMATSLYTRPPYSSEILRVSSYGVSGTSDIEPFFRQ